MEAEQPIPAPTLARIERLIAGEVEARLSAGNHVVEVEILSVQQRAREQLVLALATAEDPAGRRYIRLALAIYRDGVLRVSANYGHKAEIEALGDACRVAVAAIDDLKIAGHRG